MKIKVLQNCCKRGWKKSPRMWNQTATTMKAANKYPKSKGQKYGNKIEKIRDTSTINLERALASEKEKTGEEDMKDIIQENN